MALRIEDYALIGDCHTGALVGLDGSIDWLCLPRFDSASTFGALLGTADHGRWLVAPSASLDGADPVGAVGVSSSRRYVEDTFTLVTRWVTPTGEVDVIDLMPHGDRRADVVRRIEGVSGTVDMHQELRIRFDYGDALPWLRQMPEEGGNAVVAVAGPDAIVIRGPVLRAEDHAHVSDFTVSAGETVDIVLTWYPAHRSAPAALNVTKRIRETERWWQSWASARTVVPQYNEAVRRSLLVLRALTHEDTGGIGGGVVRALTHEDTGGIVAAATTSLPEEFGGERNWDYRYVWLRDASLTLHALLDHGFEAEADPWRRWLLRAIAGDPADVQIMYGLSGERRLNEYVVESLPGYDGASPVRVGNGAFTQYQGDVFGEVMLALERARQTQGEEMDFSWPLQRALMTFVENNWQRPDNGIWEIRGPLRHFTHSRVMLWAAFDCAVRAVREFGLDGPVVRWEQLRDLVRDEIESRGFDPVRGTYTQYYGGTTVDASLLEMVQAGYIAADDPRMLGTVAAIEEDLLEDGLLLRYRTESGVDGLPQGENPFLACSFWLAEQYARSGRLADATELMDRLVGYSNDVGLLSEEYAVGDRRQAGNTPQAFSHLSLVRAADAIAEATARAAAQPAQAPRPAQPAERQPAAS